MPNRVSSNRTLTVISMLVTALQLFVLSLSLELSSLAGFVNLQMEVSVIQFEIVTITGHTHTCTLTPAQTHSQISMETSVSVLAHDTNKDRSEISIELRV